MFTISSLLVSLVCVSSGSWEMCGPGGGYIHELCNVDGTLFALNSCYPSAKECRRSWDNGETWELATVPDYSAMGLCSDSFSRVFLPGNEYIMVSSDLGESWNTLFTLTGAYNLDVSVDPDDSLHLLVATGNISAPLIESFDGGESWLVRSDLPVNVAGRCVAFAPDNAVTVYLAGYLNGSSPLLKVYKSINNGADWTDISPYPAPQVGSYPRFDLIVSSDDENMVCVSAQHKLLFSDNGGDDWNQVLVADNDIQDLIFPGSPGSIYAVTSGKLYRTSNYGQSWQSLNNCYSLVRSMTLSDYSGTERIHEGGNTGHFYTDDPTTSWTRADTGIPGGDVFALLENNGSGFPVFSGNGYFLNEEQYSWTESGSNGIDEVYHIAQVASDPQQLFIAGDSG